MTEPESPHRDWAGIERVALICPTKGCSWRRFSEPDAKCPEHGRAVRQENRPYFGEPT